MFTLVLFVPIKFYTNVKMYFNSVLFLIVLVITINPVAATVKDNKTITEDQHPDRCKILVIGHRGASGYVPEHTLGSYALAILMGADYLEPDLVMTRDGHMVIRHDNELGQTTDVAQHPEFATRRRTQSMDGEQKTNWFTEDFTLAELKTLRAIERVPDVRPGNTRLDGSFQVPTFQEVLDLIKSLQVSQKRIIGIYPEIKHSTHFKRLGLPMERLLVETFEKYGYTKSTDPVYIQSFEISNLKELKNYTELRLVQLLDVKSLQPFDQVVLGTGLTFGDMGTVDGLKEIAKYAVAVGPNKNYVIPRDENNRLGAVTSFVDDAHAVGLKVYPYTFNAENAFLPEEFKSKDGLPTSIGDYSGEMRAYLATGIDGVFAEHPDLAMRVRGPC